LLLNYAGQTRWWSIAKSREANPFSCCAPALGLAAALGIAAASPRRSPHC
jgi:hypothetical protein